MTAEISSSVAEKAVCWCDGRKKRSSFVIETRWRRSILSESQPVRQLGGGHPSAALRARILPLRSGHACQYLQHHAKSKAADRSVRPTQLTHTTYLPSGDTQTFSADTKSTLETSERSFMFTQVAFFGGLARNVRKY